MVSPLFGLLGALTAVSVAVAQLSPSGDVRVCVDDVVEISCRSSTLRWRITVPGRNPAQHVPDVRKIEQPVSVLPGINITVLSVTNTSITSNVTVDTSYYEISSHTIMVQCRGEGEAVIKNLGLPRVENIRCIETSSDLFTLSWSLTSNTGMASVDQFEVARASSLSFLTTNNTATFAPLRDTNNTAKVTALTCVGNNSASTTCDSLITDSMTTDSTTAFSDKTSTSVCPGDCTTALVTNMNAEQDILTGLAGEYVAAIAAVLSVSVIGLLIIVICAIVLVSKKRRQSGKEKNAVNKIIETVQMDASYSHFGFHHNDAAAGTEEEYSTLNLPKLNGKPKSKYNYEQQETGDNYDYCTVGAIQSNAQMQPTEMSGSYALIGRDHELEKDKVPKKKETVHQKNDTQLEYAEVHKKGRKKETVHQKNDTLVEYAEVLVKTKPQDNLLNLDCVLILIREVASKWEDLASELSAPNDEIDHIRKTTVEDYDRLVEVCDWWIQQLYEKKSQPTWRALSKALKRVGYADLAKEIMEIYKTGKLPERVTAGPDVPDVLASIRASSSNNQATPPPLPPHTASAATPAAPSGSAIVPESTYDDVLSATAKTNELTAPPLPPPIAAYDDTVVNETPPPLPPPISSYDATVVNGAPPLPPPISSYDDNTVVNGAPPIPPKHF